MAGLDEALAGFIRGDVMAQRHRGRSGSSSRVIPRPHAVAGGQLVGRS
jgi:hypothetical protein